MGTTPTDLLNRKRDDMLLNHTSAAMQFLYFAASLCNISLATTREWVLSIFCDFCAIAIKQSLSYSFA
eukprot:m.66264 g.66264  ORF g.66264 m.66264 type:complete len:68 (+) comp15933_c1_seq2:1488-1691(+)